MTSQLLDLFGGAEVVKPAAVLTAHYGRNDALIAAVARLYIPDRAIVIDATWGRGNFWHRTDTSRFHLAGLDLLSGPGSAARADFRALPLRPRSADVVVLDPPYVHSTTQPRDIHKSYRNNETTPGKTWRQILELYGEGMAEAARVLRPGGTCWVKCQDTVEGRQQVWSIVRLHDLALELGFRTQDLFVLVSHTVPGGTRAARQDHARRNHSYLWIFRKAPACR